jgi:hemerythrin-like domain-containing protein
MKRSGEWRVSRILSAWSRKGWIKSGREQIAVTNPHALVPFTEAGCPAETFHKIVDIARINGILLEHLLKDLRDVVDDKEEEFLFPALEVAGVPREGGPIGIMLSEHEQGRKLVAKLKEAVTHYKSGDHANASSVQLIINDYVALLTQHITKENTILFPMADAKLDSSKDAELSEAFEQLERERIGVGKHDEFHAFLDQLQKTYLM